MIYKNNRICKLFSCPMVPTPGGVLSSDIVLPSVEPQPLMGSNVDDAVGNLYAQIIASAVQREATDEFRDLIIGFGDIGPRSDSSVTTTDREELDVIRQLVASARVW